MTLHVPSSDAGPEVWSTEGARPALTHVRTYETAMLEALEQTLRTIRVRIAGYDVPVSQSPFPLPSAKAAALSELIEATAAGELHAEEAQARKGRLLLQNGAEVMDLKLGHLDPIDTTAGLQGRLLHLGFYAGKIDDTLSPPTRHALQEFQESVDLDPSGEPDVATLAALARAYGE